MELSANKGMHRSAERVPHESLSNPARPVMPDVRRRQNKFLGGIVMISILITLHFRRHDVSRLKNRDLSR